MVRRVATKGSPVRRRIIASDSDDADDIRIQKEKKENERKEHIEVVITNVPSETTTLSVKNMSMQVSPRKVTALATEFSSLNVDEYVNKDKQIELKRKSEKIGKDQVKEAIKTTFRSSVIAQRIPLTSLPLSSVHSPSSRATC
ncbi:hypothetical protein PMAC_002637 [Pneumocystis sp. 'macacae']|nr:hypothetical protein PMAC_002637 [Pneumocystis sp. 'macacae']